MVVTTEQHLKMLWEARLICLNFSCDFYSMEKDPVSFRLKEGVFYGSITAFKGECEHEGEGICTFGSCAITLAKILFNLSKYCD